MVFSPAWCSAAPSSICSKDLAANVVFGHAARKQPSIASPVPDRRTSLLLHRCLAERDPTCVKHLETGWAQALAAAMVLSMSVSTRTPPSGSSVSALVPRLAMPRSGSQSRISYHPYEFKLLGVDFTSPLLAPR